MARGGHAGEAAPPPLLPTVSFQKIENDVSTQPSGVHDAQARSFGYNDFSEFNRSDQYIRHIEPLEVDLERQVEYDMDEQDQEWLDAVNTERKKEQMDKVSYEVFEVIMDRLEKEWFNLSKHIPKTDFALPSEDSTCAICDDAEGENSNAIVFCDGCNLAVHQDCYGVPYIPEGQWLCRKCTVSPENPVSCILCPNEGGAFKQTTQGQWIHLLCAIWVPETRVSNDAFMEPIIGVDAISKSRWKLRCSICQTRGGACIQCAKPHCFLAFHVSCARKDKLLLPMKSTQGGEPATLTAFCDKHLPREQAEIRDAALIAEEEQAEDGYNDAKLAKSARAYAKTYKPGPPLVPAVIMNRIQQYVGRVTIRKKPEFLAMICRYWSLKREARRGAPLLKRLHLEPWTASTSTKMDGEEEKLMKLEQLQHLRKDLEDLRNLTELTRKRETRKLKQAELIHDVLAQALFPHMPRLRAAFDKIVALDRSEYFKHPVKKSEVPDYFDVIKNPMAWSNIEESLDTYKYWDLQVFKDDVHLVLDNAILYNKPNTPYQKTALRIQAASQPILAELSQLCASPNLRSQEDDAQPWTPPPTGDLEPPLEVLDLLLSSDVIQAESDLILTADPITSLFNFELGKTKPPPPDPEVARKEERRRRDKARRDEARAEKVARQEAQKEQREQARAQAKEAPAETVDVTDDPQSAVPHASSLRRRSSGPLPRPGDIPLLDGDVDVSGTFTLFEQGWILPAGQRRTRQSTGPPPRKRARLDSGPSRFSSMSTPASDNQMLQDDRDESSMFIDDPPAPRRKRRSAGRPRGEPAEDRVVIPPPNVIRTDDGQVIIEELDTPAIRREKSIRRKEERLAEERLAAMAAADLEAADAESTTEQQPRDELYSAINGDELTPDPEQQDAGDADGESDADGSNLSALSDFETDPAPEPEETSRPTKAEPMPQYQDNEELTPQPEEEEQDAAMEDIEESAPNPAAGPSTSRARRSNSKKTAPKVRDLGRIVLRGTQKVEPGTLVWVKTLSYPWWPALVFHDNDNMVPEKVLQQAIDQRARDKSKNKGFLYIVRFWDKAKTNWQMAPAENMRLLGEYKELDQELLAKKSTMQRWKKSGKSSQHSECNAAYR
ncbi:bromodomain and PHD finger-containing protein 3 [Mycena amicta]|nr:bromodomain and PHD finger-containing protein 3 [Mycena amicta]